VEERYKRKFKIYTNYESINDLFYSSKAIFEDIINFSDLEVANAEDFWSKKEKLIDIIKGNTLGKSTIEVEEKEKKERDKEICSFKITLYSDYQSKEKKLKVVMSRVRNKRPFYSLVNITIIDKERKEKYTLQLKSETNMFSKFIYKKGILIRSYTSYRSEGFNNFDW
jgi:outer membrane phospholipase A